MKKIILFALMFCVIASSAQSAIAANQKMNVPKSNIFLVNPSPNRTKKDA
jgi:opacity protein-like surface antigen